MTDAIRDELMKELQALSPEEGCRLYAKRFLYWRLCHRTKCHRARACHDVRACTRRLADWFEEVQLAVALERAAQDPEAERTRAQLERQLAAFHRTMAYKRQTASQRSL